MNPGRIRQVGRPRTGYTAVPNPFARAVVPLAAFRVGVYLLSHADGYSITNQKIAEDTGLSLRTVVTALAELEAQDYLRRTPVMVGGRRTGTDFVISGTKLNGAESARSDGAESAPHKKTSSKKTKETNPSGGAAAAAPEAEHVEDAVKRTKQPEPAGLFEVEKPPAPEPRGAAAVVASFVLAFRQAHGETDPIQRDKGRVGRDARQILEAGQATEAELVAVAARLGAGDFANLGAELAMSRRTSPKRGRPGMAHAAPNDDPRWEAHTGPVLTDWTEDEERDFQDYLARNAG